MAKIFRNVKKKRANIFLFLLFVIVFLSFTSALKTLPQNEASRICHPVRVDGGVQSNVLCNISIEYSNGSNLVPFQAMEDLGDRFCHNLTVADTSIKGAYSYSLSCSNGTLSETEDYGYLVNLGGLEPTPERTSAMNRSIIVFFTLAVFAFIGMLFVKRFPVKLTLFLFMFWFILMGINATYISIQDEVVNTSIEGFFSFFLVLFFWANYGIFVTVIILWIITFIVTAISRKKIDLIRDYG